MPVIPARSNSVASIDSNYFVDIFVLDAAEALAKQVTLSITPTDPDKVTLSIIGGTSQIKGVDFTVIGDKLDWNGLSLETLLAEGDKFISIYII